MFMLSILSNRIRMKLNKNFMKILDSCYTYYEFIMGKKIYDTDTIGDLVKPITMMTDFSFDSSILSISLKDFRNSKLQTVEVDDATTEMLIYSLKSKYALLSYNSGHNMMDASCKNFPWKLDFSNHYATDGNYSNPGEIIQFNENEKEMRGQTKEKVLQMLYLFVTNLDFSKDVYDRANDKISFSKMTFNHEMIRLIFVEQLYRAFTIINHEPYHHE